MVSKPAFPLQSVATAQRAAAYVRVSTNRQAEHETSLADQVAAITSYCEARGIILEDVFRAPGASATDDNRPQFQAMIETATARERPYDLIVAKWPAPEAKRDPRAAGDIGGLVAVIDQVRAMRAELNIPWSATLEPHIIGGDAAMADRLAENAPILSRMAKLGAPVPSDAVPSGSAQIVVNGVTIAFPLGGAIDLDAEKARLLKAVEAAEKDRDSLAARLANPAFAERAKPEAVAKAQVDHDSKAAEAERLRSALERLG